MKPVFIKGLSFFVMIVLFSFSLIGQENNGIEPGRKYPPFNPPESHNGSGLNTDAPAGSISVAENATYNSYNPQQLVQNVLVTGCLTATNVRFGYYKRQGNNWYWHNHNWSSNAGNRQMAYFNKATSTFPLDEGILLTTGRASSAMGPNNTGSRSDQIEDDASDPDLANITNRTMRDAAVLEFDFIPAGNTLEFTYIFTSEEYIEYCETQYNDAFGFFLSGPGINGTYTNNAVNLALIPVNIPVSVNTIHPAGTNINNNTFPAENAQYYLDNPNGSLTMQFDGGTVVLTATYPVVPCSTYRIKMAVGDASDQKWDAGVFLGARSFNSESLNITNYGNFIQGQNNIFEGCNNFFRVERDSSDLSLPQNVNLILSGTCTNGVDIQIPGNLPFPSVVTIPANAAYIDIPYIAPIDGIFDNGETLVISVATSCPCASVVQYITRTIVINEQVIINSVNAINAQCNGQSNGAITVNASGGSGNYLYSIDNGSSWQSLNNFTGLNAGTYTILVRDPGSCYPDASATAVIGDPTPIVADAGPDAEICPGASAQLNGSGGVIYSWSPSYGLNFTNVANPVASPVTTTTYTLTVTNASGECASTDQVTVIVSPGPVAPSSISVNRNILCSNDNENITLTANGGSGNVLRWFAGSCGSATIGTGTSISIPSPENTTLYFARWETSCGYSGCAQITVNVPLPINLDNLVINNASCEIGNNGSIILVANGGVSPYTYSLSPNIGNQIIPGTFTNLSPQLYAITVTDANNCISVTSALVETSADTTDPLILSCSDPQSMNVLEACFGQVPDFTSGIVVSDDCTPVINLIISQSPPAGSIAPLGITPIIITVTDASGNSANCSSSLTITDNQGPTISGPGNIIVNADPGLCSASSVNLGLPAANDNCGLESVVNNAPSIFPVGNTLVTWTATDLSGLTATSTQVITVIDNQPPTIICPPSVVVNADPGQSFASGVNLGTPITSDNCGVDSTYNNAPSQFPVGSTLVTWTVIDINGLSATCTQTVVVIDDVEPIVLCPPTIEEECITVVPAAYSTYTEFVAAGGSATDSDGIDPGSFFLVSETSNNLICPEIISRVYAVADINGNYNYCTQYIIVDDKTDPLLTPPASVTVDCAAVPGIGIATATDNCDPDVTITFEGETQTPGTCPDAYTLTRTWKAVDNCGNEATASQIITVQDVTDPVLTVPEDITVECSAIPVLGTEIVTATDNCDAEVTISFEGETQTPGACPDAYTITRTWKAVDNCGNEATASQIITVQDVTDPVLTVPEDITVECSAIPALGTAVVTATDNCDTEVTITFEGETQTPGACPDAYTITRTWKALDNCGNEATASQIITVQDVTDPVLTVPEDITVECSAIPALGTAVVTATDNCDSDVTITFEGETQTPGACPDAYTLTRTWIAVDNCGNEATASQIITVQDVTDPLLTVPEDITVECSAIPALGTEIVTATDNCDAEVTITFEGETQTPGACPDAYTITRTWKAVDNCGNEATSSQIITVQDVTDPVLTVPEDITVECSAIPALGTAVVTATDNCDSDVTITLEGETQTPGACPDAYTITRTWKAVDNCGNEATASQIITVQDVTDPVLSVPEDITAECSAIPALGTAVVTATDNCDTEVAITFEGETQTPGACPDAYTITRTWKAIDNCGNEATASQIITVQDVTDPVLTVPEDITVECSAIPALGTEIVNATDNCDTEVTITFEGETQTPGACPDAYTLTRTWKAVDNCGNEATASQIITVQDVTDPVLTIPEDITVECSAIPVLGTEIVTATDNCDTEVTITFEGETQTPGACPDAYTLTRTWKAVDNCGNEATASQIITVQDVTDPVLTAPEDITVECNAIPALGTAIVTATDNCDTEVTITFEGETQTPGACPDAYTITRTWKAVDNCGNEATASQIITVQDVTDPVLTVPEDITVECSAIPALGTAVVTATDNCDTEVTITFEGETQTPGACPDAYTITLTWKAVDNCGNEATASQIITVQDVTDPVLTVPEDITVECSAIPALGTAVVTATDNCDTEVTITFEGETQTPGACPDAYTLTRNWKAVDNCGNEASASQIITVQDVTDPVLTIPEDITVECSAIPALGTEIVTATDNCDAEVTISFEGETQTPGSCPDAYTLTRTWKAVDNCGNEATASQIITVQDVTDPVLTVPEDITVECSAIPVLGTEIVTATDNCDAEVTISFEGETQTPGACPDAYTITRTWKAVDNCGNEATASQIITVQDVTDPVLTVPEDITVECSAIPALGTAVVTATDNCDTEVTITFEGETQTPGACPDAYTLTRNWKAVDNCGNEASASQIITVQDVTDPVLTIPEDITVECSAIPALGTEIVTATDNCDAEVTISFEGETQTPGSCPDAYTLTRTWKAVDNCGNEATASQIITVQDVTDPVLTVPEDITVECSAIPVLGTEIVTATDNCDAEVTISFEGETQTPGACPDAYTITRTWKAVDNCGNEATASQIITVQDVTDPVLTVPEDITVECSAIPALGTAVVTATDNCDTEVTITFEGETQTPGACPDAYTLTRTWKAVDNCGNEATASQIITVQDVTDPVLTVPEDITAECNAIPALGTAVATATDNCDTEVTITFEGETQTPGACPDAYTITRTWKAVDNCGNEATASQIITVQDVTDPVLTVPEDITVECNAIPVSGTEIVTATDNCDTEVTITFEGETQTPGACPDAYIITRTWKAVDNCGNEATASQIITVQDVTDPVLTVPEDITVECSAIPVLGTEIVTATDNCDTEVTITFEGETQTPGACPDAYTITRTWKAVDNCGNEATASQIITVQDVTDPVLTIPEDITVECSAIPVSGTEIVTATDNCDTEVTITFEGETQTPGACPDAYILTRTWKAVDNCGNEATASQIITVQDVTDPVLTVPEDITVECSAIPVLGTEIVTATDNCDTEVTITFEGETQTPGACPDAYTFTRTWKAVDNCGNEATASQIITVQDVTDPVLIVPEDITVECSGIPALGTAVVTATDNCDTEVTITFEGETQTPGACPDAYTLTRTWKAVDNCGNEATASQIITVQDVTDPVLTVPQDITIECSAVPEPGVATATDNCDIDVIVTYEGETQVPGACPGAYIITRTWKAVDNCGNEAIASQIITVQDVTSPVIIQPATDLTVECDGSGNSVSLANWLSSFGGATASDNCGVITWANDFTSLSDLCGNTGSATVTFTATDECGNSSNTSASFNIVDLTAPEINCPTDIIANNDPGLCSVDIVVPVPTYFESCGNVTLVNSFNGISNASGVYPVGVTQVTWTVNDECGNTDTCSMIVTVVDSELPSISCPADITLCVNEPVLLGDPIINDNCEIASISNNAPSTFPAGITIVTWTVIDIHGNINSCEQSVTIHSGVTASAGPDEVICEGSSGFTVTGASANNYSGLLWTSTGAGNLLNPNTLTPTYVPQAGETGNIYLNLIAYGNPPCGDITDQMLLSIIPGPVVNAGPDDSICEGSSYLVSNSSAGYFNTLIWTSNGSGTFNDPSLLHPFYTPGTGDINNGSVILTLTVYGSDPCPSINDAMTLFIMKAPEADAGPDAAICQGSAFNIEATASNYVSVNWTHTGTGSLSGGSTLTPTYTPGIDETGQVNFYLTATGNSPCTDATDTIILTIHGTPVVSAGDDAVSCDQSPYYLGTSQAENYSGLFWSSNGTGSFNDPSLLHPTYIPSGSDVTLGFVVLTLEATGFAPCGTASDSMVLSLSPLVMVEAGEDTITCSNQSITLLSAVTQGSSTVSWSHNGAGILENEFTLSPTYIPDQEESGFITLTITATGSVPCASATDSLVLEIIPAPEANAGPDLSGCDGQAVGISLATASDYNSLLWTSSGTGVFSETGQLQTFYSPSPEDQAAGSVTLTLTASGVNPCGISSDQLILTIEQGPRVDAGPDIILCNSDPFIIQGATASNYSSLSWSHDGEGILINENTLSPGYTPSAGETGTITFTLTVQGNQLCGSIVASDQVSITLSNPILVNAGPDQQIPSGSTTNISGTASGGSGFLAYNWEPASLLTTPNDLNSATLTLNANAQFVLTVMDLSTGCSDMDTLNIMMGAANLPPIANTDQDTASVSIPAIIPVLINDIDPDGFITGITIITPPNFGTVVINEDNTLTYTPVAGYEGFDTLVYQICDNGMPVLCDTALVVIRVFGERPFDDIVIYNYLTPNGDYHNDDWIIDNIQFWPENEVLIFNRWGDRIRSFAHYDNTTTVWNGTNEQGDPVPDGTYFYIVKVKHMDPLSGTMTEDAKSGYVLVKANRK